MKQKIDLKSFDLSVSIPKNERSAFQNHLKLPILSFRFIERNKKVISKEPGSSKLLHGSFFIPVRRSWNSLPTELRTIKYKREKNGRNLLKNTCYYFTKNVQLFIRTIFGMASNFSNSSKVLLIQISFSIYTPTVPNMLFLFIRYSN